MERLDQFLGVHGQALALRSERLAMLASNIANAATPGYKARDMDFSTLLTPPPASGLKATNPYHFASAQDDSSPRLRYRVPVEPSLDGNTVELVTEQLQFAETAVRYRSTLAILNGRISGLISSMKVE